MSSNQERQSRREQIMNSGKELPGDPERIKAEENEDFDAGDTGNFGTSRAAQRSPADLARRERINQSEGEPAGDLDRGDDDQFVNEHGGDTRIERPSQTTQRTDGDQGQQGDLKRRASKLQNYEELAGDPQGMEDHRHTDTQQEDAP